MNVLVRALALYAGVGLVAGAALGIICLREALARRAEVARLERLWRESVNVA